MTRAIVFVPSTDYEIHTDRCMQYLKEQGYQFEGLIRGDWAKVLRMFADDGASIAIVATEEHLDPERKPRVEVVANQPSPDRWQRTRIIRRTAEE